MTAEKKDYPITLYCGTLGSSVPVIKGIKNFGDWLRITGGKGFIRDGRMTIRRADLERAGFDQCLLAWERRLIKAILTGDTDQFKGTEFVIV